MAMISRTTPGSTLESEDLYLSSFEEAVSGICKKVPYTP